MVYLHVQQVVTILNNPSSSFGEIPIISSTIDYKYIYNIYIYNIYIFIYKYKYPYWCLAIPLCFLWGFTWVKPMFLAKQPSGWEPRLEDDVIGRILPTINGDLWIWKELLRNTNSYCLVVLSHFNPSEKWCSSSIGRMTSHIWNGKSSKCLKPPTR
jgi:hypothetical protein